MEEKIERLSHLWVAWNLKEITGNDFAMAFRREFHYETTQVWNEKTNPEEVMRGKTKRVHRDKFRRRISREMIVS